MSLKPSIYSPKRGSISKSKSIFKSILFNLDSVRSACPISRAPVLNSRAFRIELEFRNVGFCGGGKTGVLPGEKPLGAEKRTNNKLNPHMTSSPGIEPGPHWWKASALTTAPSLLPQRRETASRTGLRNQPQPTWFWNFLPIWSLLRVFLSLSYFALCNCAKHRIYALGWSADENG